MSITVPDECPLITDEEALAIEKTSLEDLLEDLTGFTPEEMQAFEETTPDVVPALESLISVVSDIRETGSISRSDAAALAQISTSLEGFQDAFELLPMGSYTELPSKVNFQPTMESMLHRIISAIVEKIKQLIDWLKKNATALMTFLRQRTVVNKKIDTAAKQVKVKFSPTTINPLFLQKGAAVDKFVHGIVEGDLVKHAFATLERLQESLSQADRTADTQYTQVISSVAALGTVFAVTGPVNSIQSAAHAMDLIKAVDRDLSNATISLSGQELEKFLGTLSQRIGVYAGVEIKLTMVAKNTSAHVADAQEKLKQLLATGAATEQISELQQRLEDLKAFERIAAACVWMHSATWNAVGRATKLLDRSIAK